MSLIVSDSGPIHYLVLCEVIDVLPKLYDRLVIPTAVTQELTHPRTPPTVSQWIRTLPAWASMESPSRPDPSWRLGLGEREAIALAMELKATQLLIDDRVARRVANQRGLLTTGTTGVLEQAALAGLLNLPAAMQRLLNTNVRIDADVIREVLARDAVRRKARGPVE